MDGWMNRGMNGWVGRNRGRDGCVHGRIEG